MKNVFPHLDVPGNKRVTGGLPLQARIAVALPGLIYALIVMIAGGFGDAVLQLTAQTGLGVTGFLKYYCEYANSLKCASPVMTVQSASRAVA